MAERWVVQQSDEEIIADLDPGIRPAVVLLRDHGVETHGSCRGGAGHAYSRPVITFGGGDHDGLRAVWLLESSGYAVSELARTWDLNAGTFARWRVDLESCQPRGEWPRAGETDHG